MKGVFIRTISLFTLLLGLCCTMLLFSAKTHAASNSYVRIIHASPFVGVADIFVDGKSLLNSFPFADVTDYVPVPPGAHKIQIALVGKGIDASVLTKELAVEDGKVYTIAAVGTSANELGLQVFVDDNQVTPDRSKVRLYHLSPDAGEVSALLQNQEQVSNLSYGNSSDYLTFDQGSYTFNVKAGQVNVPLDIKAELKPNTITSIFAVGMVNGTPKLKLITAQSTGIPGLPQTGSFPIMPDLAQPVSIAWLAVIATVIVLGLSIMRYRTRKTA